jgi:hypothetical protein
MIISESFQATAKNIILQKEENFIFIKADLERSDKNFNTDQTFQYKGGHLENREGNFFLKSINKVKYQKIPKNIFRTFKCDYKENIKKILDRKKS